MSNLSKLFQGQKKPNFAQSKNKENNLSFRNIAANNNNPYQNQVKSNKVDTSFKSICEQSSFYYPGSGEDLQEELNYVGGCIKHPNKRAQYFEQISQNQYCKLCAAQLASLGYKLQRSDNFVSRDMSPSLQVNKKKQLTSIHRQMKQVNESRTNQTKMPNSNNVPVKFSSIFSQKNKTQNLEAKYQQSQNIIDQFMDMYTEKMDKIQEIINDIRIKDIQYVKKLKTQNYQIYEDFKCKRQNDPQNGGYDLFGKSLLKDYSSENVRFQLPSEQKIQRLSNMLQVLQEISLTKQKPICTNKIPLIKSINSNSSGNNPKDFLLKNSQSISNLSSKSNFKKQKKENSNIEKFGSEINHTKHFIPEEPIQSSRFSSNSAIVRKKNNQNGNQIKTQSTQIRRRNTEGSDGGSNSCEDTPESIKSKISSNSFVLPRNAAVTMFDKINVCESIDVKVQFAEKEKRKNENFQKMSENETELLDSNRQKMQTQSSYTIKSTQSSVRSKGRKSFHRYQNAQNQQ